MYHYKRLRDLREDRDLKQKDIAEVLNDSQQHYQLYESGKREVPLWVAVKLAEFYGVSIDYIAGLTNNIGGKNQINILKEIEERKLLEKWNQLSDMEKGRILERMDILLSTV